MIMLLPLLHCIWGVRIIKFRYTKLTGYKLTLVTKLDFFERIYINLKIR